MRLNKSEINNILVITLSNIGDVILTCPVLDVLFSNFPQAKISVVVGPKAAPLFSNNSRIQNVIVFDKHQPPGAMLRWIKDIRRDKFDLTVDLRHTLIPLCIHTRYRTSLIRRGFSGHMKDKHLLRLKEVLGEWAGPVGRQAIAPIPFELRDLWPYESRGAFVVICPGAADGRKRWEEEKFSELSDRLVAMSSAVIVFIGDQQDFQIAERIRSAMKSPSLNLCGKATLTQSAGIIKEAALVITNDSAPLHLASYFNKPVVGIFGPTDPRKYGPWSEQGVFIKKETCAVEAQGAISHVSVEDVLARVMFTTEGVFLKHAG